MRTLILLPLLLAACGGGTLLTHFEPGDAPVQPMGGDRPTIALGRVGEHLAMVRLTPSTEHWYVDIEIDVAPRDITVESLAVNALPIQFMTWNQDPRTLRIWGWFEGSQNSSFNGRGRVVVVILKDGDRRRGTIEVNP